MAAVTTGWAARGTAVSTAIVPQRASTSQGTHRAVDAQLHRDQRAQSVVDAQLHRDQRARSVVDDGFSSDRSPMHQKKNAWMTRDRPPTGTRTATQVVRSPLPAVAPYCRPGYINARAPAAAAGHRDILTQLCVARC
ncbi:hypothetical protein ACOJVU_05840 [Mycobacterium sp. THU-M104]|uniref:hypothetical protein n=1 Tax=Mycobacterium sp. THU-M104 TaxID=3410515 RepID=UPI003B9BE487